jgi:hypothetical protein
MAHPRKKGGVRKDKKNEQMREDVAARKQEAQQRPSGTDQGDIVSYKPGSPEDANRRPQPPSTPR